MLLKMHPKTVINFYFFNIINLVVNKLSELMRSRSKDKKASSAEAVKHPMPKITVIDSSTKK